jgi:hypothetical protein
MPEETLARSDGNMHIDWMNMLLSVDVTFRN